MKIQGSWRFILFVLSVIVLCWAGWKGYSAYQLRDVKLTPIKPGAVNIVAISPRAGYRIIVANEIAYLAKTDQSGGDEKANYDNEGVANASRLPLRELLQTLQGDEKALGVLVMRLNDWPDTDTAARTPVWKAEDIRKAIDGDSGLLEKLVSNLNVDLSGMPLEKIDVRAINAGILIDSPVTMEVTVGEQRRTMTGRVQEFYQPQFCQLVASKLNERFNPSAAFIEGTYRDLAKPIIEANQGEDVRKTLENKISAKRLDSLGELPLQVLDNTQILLNESYITSASFTNYDVGQGDTSNDVRIGLTEPGRMRLWKYSHDNQGFQLLFIVNTIALAAPRITTELAESNVVIRRVPSKELVADAIDTINGILTSEKK